MATPSLEATLRLNPVINTAEAVKQLNQLEKQFQGGLGVKGFGSSYTSALGNMTGATRSFDQVLNAANRRVIGFGLSLGVIGGSIKIFKDLISVTREMDSTMARLQSVMSLTGRQTNQVFRGLFDVARQTGESIQDAAKAFEAFSKQGGNVETVMKRTTIALGLAKVTGIETTEAVNGLIASVNTFRKAGESYATIADKISAANRGFRISGEDALKVISGFGEEAQDASVSLNKLLGIVSALETRTNQSGSTISTSLGRIFSRLDPATLSKLSSAAPSLNFKDQNGQFKNASDAIDEIARKYKTLSATSQDAIAKTLGSTRDLNTLKVLISELSNANSIANTTSKALDQSSGDLNARLLLQTSNLDQSLKNLKTTATEVGAIVGKFTLAPALNNLTKVGNLTARIPLLASGESEGAHFAQDVLKGIGGVLSGPGLVVLTRILSGVIGRTVPEVFTELKRAGGFGQAINQDQAAVQGLNKVLSQATQEELRRYEAANSVAERERIITGILTEQLLVMENIARVRSIAGFSGTTLASLAERGVPDAAGGFIPAMGAESRAIAMGIGGAPSTAKPVYLPGFAGGGIVANNSEFKVPMGVSTAIYNRAMIQKYGLPPGSTPIAAGGYVPNMAAGGTPAISETVATTLRRVSPLFTPQIAGQDPIEQFQKGIGGLIKKGFDLSSLDLNVPEKTLRKSVKSLITESLQIQPAALEDPKVRAALTRVTSATLEAQSNRISYYRQLQRQSPRGIFYNGEGSESQVYIPSLTGFGEGSHPPAPGSHVAGGITPSQAKYFNTTYPEGYFREGAIQSQLSRANSQQYGYPIGPSLPTESVGERQARRARLGNRLQLAAIGLSFAGGAIPELPGGTQAAQNRGALSGFASGAGFGASIGSFLGPEGTIIGGIAGGLYGGVRGYIDKKNPSLQELAQSIQNQGAPKAQLVKNANDYIQARNDLREAASSGANPDTLRRLQSQVNYAYAQLPDNVQKQFKAAGDNQEAISNELGTLISDVGIFNQRGNATTAIAQLAEGGGDNDIAAQGFAGQFVGKSGIDFSPVTNRTHIGGRGAAGRFVNLPSQQLTIARLAKQYSDSGADETQVNQFVQAASKLDVEPFFKWLATVAKDFNATLVNAPGIDKVSSVNYKKLSDDIQAQIEGLESALNQTAGLKAYLSQASGQRVSAAARILGEGKVRGLGGKFGNGALNALDLEGSFRVQQAQQEAGLGNARALEEAQATLFTKLNADVKNYPDEASVRGLQGQISGATTVDQLRDIADKLGLKDTEIKKMTAGIETAAVNGQRQVQLAIDSNILQKLELQATQQNALLSKGTFNLSKINEFGLLAGARAGGIGSLGSYNSIQGQLHQSEFLDQLGLLPGSHTADLQRNLRVGSTLGTLRTLTSRALGRPVGGSISDIQQAAEHIKDTELGERIFNSAESLRTNPADIAKNILSNPGAVGLSGLQSLTASGQISLGDATIIQRLDTIADHTDPSKPKTPAGTIGGPNTSHSNGIIEGGILPPFTVTGKTGYNPNQSKYSPSNSPFAQFGRGFSGGLQDIGQLKEFGGEVLTLGQIGTATAKNLDSAFGNYFSNLIVGADRGKNAFRQFASSVFADASKLFSTNAITQAFGLIGQSLGVKNSATGGPIGLASGGMVPVMLTGGEYVFGPQAARRLGPGALRALNRANGGIVQGGSGVRDDVPGMLPQGSFVIKRSAAQRLGSGYLNSLANGGYLKRDMGGDTYDPYDSTSPVAASSGLGGVFLSIFEKLATSGLLAGIGLATAPSRPKILDTPGIIANARQLEAQQARDISNRPAGSYSNVVRGPNGSYNLIGYNGLAAETNYSNHYASGGYVSSNPSSGSSVSSSGPAAVINPVITINHYGSSNSSSSVTTNGDQDFADKLHKAVKQVVDERFVEAQRVGGANYITRRFGSGF